MIRFPCPKCGFVFQAQDDWAGKKAKCNQCGERVIVPVQTAHAEFPTIETVRRRPTKLGELSPRRRGTANAMFLDVGFEKYLTPWIIRATWIAALILVPTSLLLFTIGSVVLTFMGEVDHVGWTVAGHFFSFLVSCIVMVAFLLWLRVILESIIVLFNVATTLREIKEATRT